MFRDTKEELDWLEAELMAQEEEETEALPEEDDDPVIYANYANGYMQEQSAVPNYKAYNTDITDEDLESYSEAVRQPKKRSLTGLLAFALVLLTAILCVLAWWVLRFGGMLG